MAKKRMLITGGTGFLGKHLAVALKGDYEITLTGRNINQNLKIEKETSLAVLPMNISQIESVRDIFNRVNPEIVIHAAASKYVQMGEINPLECIDTNVLGSQNIARVCVDQHVKHVIGISTDKAAPPTISHYGLSKALMERMFCALGKQHTQTTFSVVRFGNFFGSTGSLLDIWKTNLKHKKSIPVTNLESTRFGCTMNDAITMIVLVLKNPNHFKSKICAATMKSFKLEQILNIWLRFRGGEYEFIGDRLGDNLHECLVGEAELMHTNEKKIDNKLVYIIDLFNKNIIPYSKSVCSKEANRFSQSSLEKIIAEF
jgi:UDP-N-acetylglucosamine 4,6-dehydratase/5-epimerase